MRSSQTALMVFCCLVAAPAYAQKQTGEKPPRVVSLIVYGDDPCPEGSNGEIVVCAREPESERYRVPKSLRKKPPEPAQRSWKERAEGLDEATRATRPNSCSAVGGAGQTGCTAEMLRLWKAEQRAKKQAAAAGEAEAP